MTALPPTGADAETDWQKNQRLVRLGFKDLEYLPTGRTAWNATLAALAFSARRHVAGSADLNVWAMMHGCPPSARYEELGGKGLVLWHGTTARRAEKIRERGLMHKRGVWAATDPRISHGFTRGRSRAFGAGSAMVVFLIDTDEWDGRAEAENEQIARFHESIPPECIEYILFSDRIDFCGQRKAAGPKPWTAARFKRRAGQWVPRSRPPVRLDASRSYRDLDEWLDESIRRILTALGPAAAIEVFASLYAMIDPWDALEHRAILAALERLCGPPRIGRGRFPRFALADHALADRRRDL